MNTKPVLNLDDCRIISEAAEAEARRNEWEVVIAVFDDGGHVLHVVRMDGATAANGEIAQLKARTAALSRRPTRVWEERVTDGRISTLSMPVLAVQGGLPIEVDGVCIGAVGVSGVQSHEDEQIARAGIDALANEGM